MSDLKKVRVLTLAAMLIAVSIVLGFFKLPISPALEIRFTSLPIAMAGFLMGPMVGAAIGVISDIGAYIVRPTGPFFAGFTVSAAVMGLIFGTLLHKKKLTWMRVFASQAIVGVLVGILMNSFWLAMLFDKGFIAIMMSRIVKELIMIPLNTFILMMLIKAFPASSIGMQRVSEP